MLLKTSRFGTIKAEAHNLIVFPEGLAESEIGSAWLLLTEPGLWWLQSTDDPNCALPLVDPFEYVPTYRLHVSQSDRSSLLLNCGEHPLVVTVLRRIEGVWTINLRDPLIIRSELRLGRQIRGGDHLPTRHLLPAVPGILRKCA